MVKITMQHKPKLIEGSQLITEDQHHFLLLPKTSKLDLLGVKYWKAPEHYKLPVDPYALFIVQRLDGQHSLENIEQAFNAHFNDLPNKSRDRFLRLVNKIKKWLVLN